MAALRAWGLCGGTGSGAKTMGWPDGAHRRKKPPAPVAVPGLVLSGYPRSDLGKPVLTAEPAPLRHGSGSHHTCVPGPGCVSSTGCHCGGGDCCTVICGPSPG
jgi:hypothetical protein